MNRLIACGLLASMLVLVGGCGPSLEQQRRSATAKFELLQLEQAEAQFKEILDRHPADSLSYYYMGRICHAQKRYAAATYNYQCAVSHDPSNAQARHWLDRCVEESGQDATTLFVPKTKLMN